MDAKTEILDFGDKVTADGEEIVMTVTAITVRKNDNPVIECQYWFNGELKVVYIPMWRLKKCE